MWSGVGLFVGIIFEKVWEPKIWVAKHCNIKGVKKKVGETV